MHLPLSLQWLKSHKGTCFVGSFTPWMTTLGVSRWGQKVKPVCLVRVRLEVLISTLSFQNAEKLVFLCMFIQPHTMFVSFTLWISSLLQWFTYFSALCCLQISGTSGPSLLHWFLIHELISFLSNRLSGCDKSQTEKKSYNVTNFIDSEDPMINLLGTVWLHDVIVTSWVTEDKVFSSKHNQINAHLHIQH